jgi:hypothetical protein
MKRLILILLLTIQVCSVTAQSKKDVKSIMDITNNLLDMSVRQVYSLFLEEQGWEIVSAEIEYDNKLYNLLVFDEEKGAKPLFFIMDFKVYDNEIMNGRCIKSMIGLPSTKEEYSKFKDIADKMILKKGINAMAHWDEDTQTSRFIIWNKSFYE